MKNFGKIMGYNMLILLGYTIAIQILGMTSTSKYEKSSYILMAMILPVALHVLVNFILMIINFAHANYEIGKSYLLSTFLVLIIGFSACWGSSAI